MPTAKLPNRSRCPYYFKRAVGLLISLLSVLILLSGLPVSLSCGKKKPLDRMADEKAKAVIIFLKGDVGLKNPRIKAWIFPGFSTPVDDGEIINTQTGAEAFLFLGASSWLYLAERTTVRFHFTRNRYEIEVLRGDLRLWTGKTGTKMTVVTPGGVIKGKQAVFCVNVTPAKSFSLAVVKGSTQVNLPGGERKKVSSKDVLTLRFASDEPEPLSADVESIAARMNPSPLVADSLLPKFFADKETREAIESDANSKVELGAPDEWTYVNLGRVLFDRELFEDSRANFLKSLDMKADLPQALSGVGMTLAAQRSWNEAIDFFKRALRIDGSSPEALTGLGISYIGAGNLSAAEKTLKSAIRVSGGDSKIYSCLAMVEILKGNGVSARDNLIKTAQTNLENPLPLLLLGAVEMVDKSLGRGVSRVKRAYDSTAFNPVVSNTMGVIALKNGRGKLSYFEELKESENALERLEGLKNSAVVYIENRNRENATRGLKEALNIKSDSVTSYADLGYVFFTRKEFENSLSCYMEAASIEPENCIWREWIALVNLRRGDLIGASAAADEALMLNPRSWAGFLIKGIALFEKGEHQVSMSSLGQGLGISPKSGLSSFEHCLKGAALIRMGQYEKAICEFNRAIRIDSSWAEYFRLRGDAYSAQGKYDEALSSYRSCLDLDPDDKTARVSICRILMNEGKHQQAREELEEGLRRQPEDADYVLDLARCLIKSKNYSAALERIDKALSTSGLDNPQRVEFFILRGLAYLGLKENERSIEAFRAALEIDLTRGDAWFYMGSALEQLGRNSEAVQAYKQSVECSTSLKRWEDLRAKALKRIGKLGG